MSKSKLVIPDFQFGAIDSQWQSVTGGYFIYRNTSAPDTLSMHIIATGATGTVTFLKSNTIEGANIQAIKDNFLALNNSDGEAMVFNVATANAEQGTNDISRNSFIGIFVEVTAGLVKFYDNLN